ncbi:ABC transporter permease [Paenibacillus koleovorans]|uniref:ABC transporter permease n=1 Tax=Paenibacillus koleovorans TaxID=121608 RepID=UPI000FDB5C89|nr:ABC transporter permease subunit [Paenibacillus koleovorans]
MHVEAQAIKASQRKRSTLSNLWKYRALYFISLPGLIYFAIFKYVPLAGNVIAFQNYNIFRGVFKSPWVGWDHFKRMFDYADFHQILANTLLINLYDLLFGFTAPIVLALLLNEVRRTAFKRVIQTTIFMPHFLSWVIISGIFIGILSPSTGIINQVLAWIGMEPIYFMAKEQFTRSIIVVSGIWRDSGWGIIVYLAALAAINPNLYEAAEIDGANRWHQTIYITFPAILPTVTVLFLLNIGNFLDFGFERVYVFLNPLNNQTGQIFDTYIYEAGLRRGQFSYTTAVGLFKSVSGLALLVITNWLSKRATGNSLY